MQVFCWEFYETFNNNFFYRTPLVASVFYSWINLSAKNVLSRYYRILRIFAGKKHSQIKFQLFSKLWVWSFGSLVYQIKSLYQVLQLKQNFRKYKVVAGKTPFFVIDLFCSLYSICLNNGFWLGSFIEMMRFLS